jgi:hypothetical protein
MYTSEIYAKSEIQHIFFVTHGQWPVHVMVLQLPWVTYTQSLQIQHYPFSEKKKLEGKVEHSRERGFY